MRILLIGEYSNVHWTLAEGLRALGHNVTVVSDGDAWKGYTRDIDLRRHDVDSPSRLRRTCGAIRYAADLARVWPRLRGYDIVQLINPVFIDLRAERIMPFYRYLRRHNGRIVLGAFGIDHYWVRVGMDCKTFRYSDFNFGSELRSYPFMDTMIADWLRGPKGELNQRIADDADGIVSGLYEYHRCYLPFYADKLVHIPFPIKCSKVQEGQEFKKSFPPLRCFIGIQRERSAYKGTDIMLRALERLKADYPDKIEILRAENVPFDRYRQMMDGSHIILDQLYSYTPAMNALLAMAKGIIVVGGGEHEHYDLIGEHELRPIINVQPNEDDVYRQIRDRLLLHPDEVPRLQRDSIEYVRRHHDYISVARRYEEFYQKLIVEN